MKRIENTQCREIEQVVRDLRFGLCFEPASYNIFKTYYNPIMSWKDKSELFVMTPYELQSRLVRPVMAVTQGAAQKGWIARFSESHARQGTGRATWHPPRPPEFPPPPYNTALTVTTGHYSGFRETVPK